MIHSALHGLDGYKPLLGIKYMLKMLSITLGSILLFIGTSDAIAQHSTTQSPPSTNMRPPPSLMPVPDELELAKLIWSTMAAIDHANIAGNYSVLRDLSAPSFQQINNPAKLSQTFSSLRDSNIDLSNTLLLAPSYTIAPAIVRSDILHVKGVFGLRPTAIGFDLYYQWVEGRWRLYGVSIAPASLSNVQPARRTR